MGTKLIIWLFSGVGIPAYIATWLIRFGWINISGGKELVLFILAVLFGTARLIVYCVESYQRIRYRQKKLKNK